MWLHQNCPSNLSPSAWADCFYAAHPWIDRMDEDCRFHSVIRCATCSLSDEATRCIAPEYSYISRAYVGISSVPCG